MVSWWSGQTDLVFVGRHECLQDLVIASMEFIDGACPVHASLVNEGRAVCNIEYGVHVVRHDNTRHIQLKLIELTLRFHGEFRGSQE